MKYFTAEQARNINSWTKKEKRRLSKRIKEIAKQGYNHAKLKDCQDYTQTYKNHYIEWLSELGYLCYFNKEKDIIFVYFDAKEIQDNE